ncbi:MULTISPECIES: hypothetical protein [unclassified Variovorax]|uniref:hypothetical protein n=1 Tax=unclassified Variovorax TaxID=663243 RepID=UPI000C99DD84|nr:MULTISPECIES: hypothetical protein [unclassified Variovorax]VTV17822.1 hypothetical protein WDL1P1_00688 [Variovorax sp. WDL1]
MNLNPSTFTKWAAAGVVAAGALFAGASANAQVNWSVGISAPGVAIGVAEPGPVYYEPAPVYSRPAPIYYQPAPPVYDRPPPPAYYRPAPVYYGPPAPAYYGQGERWRHRHHHRRDWDDRGGDRD